MFAALGRFSYRFRWPVVAGWLVLFALGLVATARLGHVLVGGGFVDRASPSQRAAALIERRLHQGRASIEIIFTSDHLEAGGRAFLAAESKALSRLSGVTRTAHPPASDPLVRTVPDLETILTYESTGDGRLVSRDGRSSVAVLSFRAPADKVRSEVTAVRGALVPAGLRTYVTGEPAFHDELSTYSARDLRRVEAYAMPFALIVLVLVFGTLVSAALPVVTGAMAVSVTLGVVYLLAHETTMSIFVMNTATLLGLAVGIDYALFMVARFREELAAGAGVGDAVVTTVARAGRSVFFSGLAVTVGVLGMTFFPYPGLRSIGIGGGVVVLFSILAAVTLLPALLGILGPRVNAVRVLPLRQPHESSFWKGWAALVLRRRAAVIVVALALIGVVAWPVVRVKTAMPTATALPSSAPSRQGYDILHREFDAAAISPISVLITWSGGTTPFTATTMLALYGYGRQLAATPGVAAVQSIVNLPGINDLASMAAFWRGLEAAQQGKPPAAGTVKPTAQQIAGIKRLIATTTAHGAVLFRVVTQGDPASSQAQDVAHRIVELTPPGGMTAHVAGESAADYDFFHGLTARFPWVIGFVLVATYLILLFLVRSVLVPFKAVIVNGLTILMSYGATVFIFQDGRFERLLGFTGTGTIDAIMPVVMFCVLFGVSMDYEVFSVTRMHEAWLAGGDGRTAVAAGLVRSGRVILSAALLVVVVAASFAFTRISMTKMLGVGIAVAITFDALFIRMSLVPALMGLLGRAGWWLPRWLDRLLPGVGGD